MSDTLQKVKDAALAVLKGPAGIDTVENAERLALEIAKAAAESLEPGWVHTFFGAVLDGFAEHEISDIVSATDKLLRGGGVPVKLPNVGTKTLALTDGKPAPASDSVADFPDKANVEG
jgi:hypothetical protein